MFQDALLFPHLTVGDNLAFGLSPGGSSHARRDTVAAALAAIGMAGMEDRDPATLSGGQKARAALMRTLLAEPDALLLDEPFSSLDDQTRDEFIALVLAKSTRQLPTMLVSHDPRDAECATLPPLTLSPCREIIVSYMPKQVDFPQPRAISSNSRARLLKGEYNDTLRYRQNQSCC